MSEMKPVAWLIEASDGGRFLAFNDQSMGEPNGESLTAIYTADQLAEAVTAERERCAKVCDELSRHCLSRPMAGNAEALVARSLSICADTIRETRTAP